MKRGETKSWGPSRHRPQSESARICEICGPEEPRAWAGRTCERLNRWAAVSGDHHLDSDGRFGTIRHGSVDSRRRSRDSRSFGGDGARANPRLNLQYRELEPVGLTMTTAVLLIAHGSRRPDANRDLVELAQLVQAQGGYSIVEPSYLELTEPTIPAGGRACVARGATRVLMLPYFLSAGVHVVQDLEAYRAELTTEFPQVEFVLCEHLGLDPLMVALVLKRLREAKGTI